MENPALERWGTSEEDGHNDSSSEVSGSGTSKSTTKSKNVGSDLPASIISADDIGSVTYGQSGNMAQGSQDGSQTSKSSGKSASDHSIERTFKEYGNQLKSYLEYYQSYVNIMQELLNSFDDMFIQLLF